MSQPLVGPIVMGTVSVIVTFLLIITTMMPFSVHSKFIPSHPPNVIPSSKPLLPVLLMHGVTVDNNSMSELRNFILESTPGTIVLSLPCEDRLGSLLHPMSEQLELFARLVEEAKAQYSFRDHHLICHSQGGLLCRSYLQMYPKHTVRVFVSLSGVQNGEFGIPGDKSWELVLKDKFPFLWNMTADEIYTVFYTDAFQKLVSVANYWKDPYHMDSYRKHSQFLAVMNNDTTTVDYASKYHFRENMLRIDKMILNGSPQDEIIKPYFSAFFDYYKYDVASNSLVTESMKFQSFYRNDVFGLKTLDRENRLIIQRVPNVTHKEWITNQTLYELYLRPFLY
ncbi:hypothetical protein FDP41_005635 [Naegleria fowleri]|uniref:palmitoyl-CoA hydrolase n=1 Tax=Naegleria fowleri TaxID=5763 RepID=A0A6A5BMW1_NAEFO|nr:uncharacterized protein FDP41_005635 [Naegleria fowleri]KAF0975641.1 hypothetical protein FDP41_005635 [Naegleria fowleri]